MAYKIKSIEINNVYALGLTIQKSVVNPDSTFLGGNFIYVESDTTTITLFNNKLKCASLNYDDNKDSKPSETGSYI